MTEQDPVIAGALDQFVPFEDERREWQRILDEARARPRPALQRRLRRRHLLAVAVALLAIVVPLAAVGATQGWWFLAHNSAKPVTSVAVVATGVWSGSPWTLTAYRSATDGICTALTPSSPANEPAGVGAGMGCDSITGVPRTAQSKRFTPHGISYLQSSGGGGFPGYIIGPVIDSARSVEITLSDNTTLKVTTISAPASLQSKIRFFVTELPRGRGFVRKLAARDLNDKVVAVLRVPQPLFTRAENRISNHGSEVKLSQAMKRQLRLAHRRAQVWLLASRDGHNFYRFGRCFGVGRSGDPSRFDAARGPAAFGAMLCSRRFPSRAQPILDASIYGASRKHPRMTLLRLSGFASDAVVGISLLDATGRIVRRVPVIGNVYSLANVPPAVATVVMTDSHGRQVARCGPNVATAPATGSYVVAKC
jgi:hypothetical protein